MLRDKLSLKPITLPPKRNLGLLLDHWLLIQKRVKSEPIQLRLRVEEEKSLMQQLRKATLKKKFNLI
jgi:hypothetical protein